VQLESRDKTRLDALADSTQRQRSRRAWCVWLVVAVTSLGIILLGQYDAIPPYVRVAMAVIGSLGLLLLVAFWWVPLANATAETRDHSRADCPNREPCENSFSFGPIPQRIV
jgi:hypothetical protein